MATHHGKEGAVKFGANAVAEVTQFTIEETADTADDSAMGDSAKTHLVGLTAWSAELTCHWDETNTNGQGIAVGTSVTFNGYPEGASTGDSYKTGTATVTKKSIVTELNGVVQAQISLQGNGALSDATA